MDQEEDVSRKGIIKKMYFWPSKVRLRCEMWLCVVYAFVYASVNGHSHHPLSFVVSIVILSALLNPHIICSIV